MTYCFNPVCEHPENPDDGNFCKNCGSRLLLNLNQNGSAYRGIQLIGQGGFGRTFLAVDDKQPHKPRCVIKQFFSQGVSAQKAAELFQQEAERLEVLGKHPQIPERFAYFEQEGYQYLVQEFIEGRNLAQELLEKGAFDQKKIHQLLIDLLPVLQFVHGHKVIHRDIKPENIIRRYSGGKAGGELVLVDFGAAKLVTGGMLPKTGTIIGSAAYTAPEQLMGKAVFASDIYSLGVTCIHLLTNIPPFDLFESQDCSWAWRAYLKTPVSDELGNILDKMLQGPTSKRYHSVAAVLRQLQPQPEYVEAMPGLKIQQETGFNPLPQPQPILTSPPNSLQLPKPSTNPELIPEKLPSEFIPAPPNQIEKIQQRLQTVLNAYQVKVQVNQTGREQLTLVLNREENTSLNYAEFVPLIGYELTELRVKGIERVKLLGRVNKRGVPEWQMMLKLDRKTQFNNKIIRLQNNAKAFWLTLVEFKNPQYWLKKFKQKNFWLDALMFAMVAFIFSHNIIIASPWLAVIIAGAFLGIKTAVIQTHEIALNKLFGTIATLFILFGWLDLKIWVEGMFGIILAGLFLSIPVFYTKTN